MLRARKLTSMNELVSPVEPSKWPVRFFWYSFTAVLATLFPVVGYRLDLTSIYAPLSHESDRILYNDAFLILPMVQSTLETGTHWSTERLGFPGVQDMHDFPVIDHFHFLWLWIIGQFTGSTILTFNLYYLLGYPLAALTMLAVARHYRITFPAAVTVALFFAALPFHQNRSTNHYFLSAYYIVPLTCLVILWICVGQLPFFPKLPEGYRFTLRNRTTAFSIVIMLVTSSAGAYYAFFACGLLAAAGLFGWLSIGTWRAVVSAGAMIGLIVFGGLVNHLPKFRYQAEFGKHPAPIARLPEEAESHGMKITQLVMPIDNHKIRELAEYKSIYNSYLRPVQASTERYSLGTVTALGFVGLMACLLLPVGRRQPVLALAAMTGFAVAIGTVGGLGSIFNSTITPAVRCYNRIAIYIAVFSLLAVALAGDGIVGWLVLKCHRRLVRVMPVIFWGCILWFGLWDMTPYDWGKLIRADEILKHQKRWFEDDKFFSQIEEQLNPDGSRPGPAVFQLPYVPWPESPATNQLASYDHVRGYLHTRTLRWSFGCIKGREVDDWYRSVAVLPPTATDRMLDRLALAGFEGLLFDKRGYSPAMAQKIEESLVQKLPGAPRIIHPDGQQHFFDLRRFRDDIRPGRDWDREAYQETHRFCVLWFSGFVTQGEPGYEWKHRLCGPDGEAFFVNPSQDVKTVTLSMRFSTEYLQPSALTISGGDVWSETFQIHRGSGPIRRTLTIPPGRHRVRFYCQLPETHMANESQRLSFAIDDFVIEQ